MQGFEMSEKKVMLYHVITIYYMSLYTAFVIELLRETETGIQNYTQWRTPMPTELTKRKFIELFTDLVLGKRHFFFFHLKCSYFSFLCDDDTNVRRKIIADAF